MAEAMVIDIIERDERGNFIVRVGRKFTITTTVDDGRGIEKEWIREVNRIYGKNGRHNLVVGLCGDRDVHYSCPGGWGWYDTPRKDENMPLDMLQLCVGYHCLLYFPAPEEKSKALEDFFGDRRNTFVGVGIEKIAKKMEKFIGARIPRKTKKLGNLNNGIVIKRRLELRELAAEKGYVNKDDQMAGGAGGVSPSEGVKRDFRRYSLSELAKVVLGEGMDFEKPRRIEWESNEFVKYATTEAFLASQIGAELMKNSYN